MTRLYTRGGDRGETSLGDGARVPKNSRRVGVYGEVDELNCVLGCCVSLLAREGGSEEHGLAAELTALQSRLFDLGTVLADLRRSIELLAAGANIIGGCCGSTPAHIAAMKAAADARNELSGS